MKFLLRKMPILVAAWTLNMLMAQLAQSHLMAAQHGTLNIVDDGVFMVMSLPISAFSGVDDNNDGKVSMIEFNNHRGAIIESVEKNVVLSDEQGKLSLHGVMLSPVLPHNSTGEAISQLTVMGRFTLIDYTDTLHLQIALYGKLATEKSMEITATRARDNQKAVFTLTRATPKHRVFPARV